MNEIHIAPVTGLVSKATIEQRVERRIAALGEKYVCHPKHAPTKRKGNDPYRDFLIRQQLRALEAGL